MSEASDKSHFRDPGEFCCGSHSPAVPEADGRAVCPYCGVRRKLRQRNAWDADVAAALRATPAIAFDGKNSRARASARGPRTHTQRRWPYALAPCLKNIAMPRLIDHHASRALAYRTRAIELAQQAKREDDPGQRRYLLDLARNMVNVADALAPPDEPQLFRTAKEAGARAKENGGS